MWPWEAACLWFSLLRKLDRAGVLELGRRDPAEMIAMAVRTSTTPPVELVRSCLSVWVESGAAYIQDLDDGRRSLVVPSFLEAQEAVQSDAARQRRTREARRDRTKARLDSSTKESSPDLPLGQNVTTSTTSVDILSQGCQIDTGVTVPHLTQSPTSHLSRDVTGASRDVTRSSRAVTRCHAESRAVTSGHSSLPNQPNQPSLASRSESSDWEILETEIRRHQSLRPIADPARLAEQILGYSMTTGATVEQLVAAIERAAAAANNEAAGQGHDLGGPTIAKIVDHRCRTAAAWERKERDRSVVEKNKNYNNKATKTVRHVDPPGGPPEPFNHKELAARWQAVAAATGTATSTPGAVAGSKPNADSRGAVAPRIDDRPVAAMGAPLAPPKAV